jgi:hypothetical protein
VAENAIHELAPEDVSEIPAASKIPPIALTKPATEIPKPVLRKDVAAPRTVRILLGVEGVEMEANDDDRAFDAYVMVDWSSSSSPASGNDSIWIASGAWSGRFFAAGSPQNVSAGSKQ